MSKRAPTTKHPTDPHPSPEPEPPQPAQHAATTSPHEARRAMVEARIEAAIDRTPTRSDWGIESYGDAPAVMGGGVGGFLWFASREELFRFVADALLTLHPAPRTTDTRRIEAVIRAHLDAASVGTLSLEDTRMLLNRNLRRIAQIRWWGPLEDLRCSDAEFPRQLRAWARDEYADDQDNAAPGASEAPVTDEELDDFVEAIRTYGL
jgi:hypothetical protein